MLAVNRALHPFEGQRGSDEVVAIDASILAGMSRLGDRRVCRDGFAAHGADIFHEVDAVFRMAFPGTVSALDIELRKFFLRFFFHDVFGRRTTAVFRTDLFMLDAFRAAAGFTFGSAFLGRRFAFFFVRFDAKKFEKFFLGILDDLVKRRYAVQFLLKVRVHILDEDYRPGT
jgi:hypothetical protein